MLVHNVYFYLKSGLNDEEREYFFKQLDLLTEIEAISSIHIGTPAETEERDVIVKDYDCALTVIFQSMEDHDVYQDHEKHHEFINTCKDLWERVAVYDAD